MLHGERENSYADSSYKITATVYSSDTKKQTIIITARGESLEKIQSLLGVEKRHFFKVCVKHATLDDFISKYGFKDNVSITVYARAYSFLNEKKELIEGKRLVAKHARKI
jgi:hypothetical protein